jgi:hypothetical protein
MSRHVPYASQAYDRTRSPSTFSVCPVMKAESSLGQERQRTDQIVGHLDTA